MFTSFMRIRKLNKNLFIIYFMNILFIIMLILQLLWAIEIKKMNKYDLNIPIIVIIIISIGIASISYINYDKFTFCFASVYIFLWLYIIYTYSIYYE